MKVTKMNQRRQGFVTLFFAFLFSIGLLSQASAQTCASTSELEAPMKSSIESAVSQYFQLAHQGNSAALQQVSTPDFTEVGNVIVDNKDAFSGTATVRLLYVLDHAAQPSRGAFSGPQKQDGRVEFFCGIFNSPDRVGFVFPSLPPGVFSVVVQDAKSDKGAYSIAWILQESGNQWKIAGLIPKSTQIGGHDGNWFIQQARAYKAKRQMHNAWFYYVMGDDLLRPLASISTPQLDKLYDEFQPSRPADLPTDAPVALAAPGKTYNVTTIFPAPVGDAIDLVVKYQTPDISDVGKAYQDNLIVIKAMVNKYPEFREAFGGIVARAVAPSGQDYGTLLAMKDVK